MIGSTEIVSLYERNRGWMLQKATASVGATMAEDVVQEVFIALLKRRRELDQKPGIRSWLKRTLQYICLKVHHDASREEPMEHTDDIQRRFEDPGEPVWIDDLLAFVPKGGRDLVVMRHLQGWRPKEIAEATGMNLWTCYRKIEDTLEGARKVIR